MIPLCERTVIAGKYQLVRELATGGMGAVWVARHLALDEDVAIKFMSASLPESADARARFAREARAAARLRGPHVVQVLDHGVDGDVPYLVMELLEGEHLGERLRREGRLSLRHTAVVADQVAKALTRAHRAGIVHRDLKPANVFLARADGEEIVKILDFGIAKHVGGAPADVTHTDVLMGSPQYMSPEQARGARGIDHRADLFSFGAILFRAVTGVPAFEGTSAVDVIVRICAGPPPLASQVAKCVPPALDPFFRRALDRDPERRFGSAREMADAFAALVRQLETTAAGEVGSGPRAVDDERDSMQTQVTVRLARSGGAPAARAAGGEEDVEAFVERAFHALIAAPEGPGEAPITSAPETTTRSPTMDDPPRPSRAPESTIPLLRRPNAVAMAAEPRAESSGHDTPAPPKPPIPPGATAIPKPRVPVIPRRGAVAAAEVIALDQRERRDPDAQSGDRWLAPVGHGTVATLIDQGFTALRRGERETARRVWREALGLDPNNRLLELNLRRLDALGGRRE